MTAETGALTAIFQTVDLALFLAIPEANYHEATYVSLFVPFVSMDRLIDLRTLLERSSSTRYPLHSFF